MEEIGIYGKSSNQIVGCLNNRKRQTVWRLNVGILYNEQRNERVKAEIKGCIKANKNGAVDPTIF